MGTVEEAQALREARFEDEGDPDAPGHGGPGGAGAAGGPEWVCTISSVDTGLALNAVAENRSTVAEAHIQVDTGMGFGGFLVGEPEKNPAGLPLAAQRGPVRHLYPAPRCLPKGPEVGAQLRQFHQVLDAIHAAGFETGTVHAAMPPMP